MSRREQDALLALFNSFRPSRRVTAFEQLSDGKVLMEVMHSIDETHFKGGPKAQTRNSGSASNPDNWVLRMNILKRLYRLLLSYPLNAPNAPTLSVTNLHEPNFNAIARNPKSSEGEAGLVQICRLCVAIGAIGPANERVIAKIQALDENAMAELMKTIEGVMATLPQGPEGDASKDNELLSPLPSSIRDERDRLVEENETMRARFEELTEQMAKLKSDVSDANAAHDADKRASAEAARKAAAGTNEVEVLRVDLARAEDGLAETEAALEEKRNQVAELTKTVEELRDTAAEVAKLRDQADEYRQVQDRLHKSENVIEKYKKKLEDSAGLRRELRQLEEENTTINEKNSELEVELRKLRAAKTVADNYRSQLDLLEKKANEQAREFAQLTVQLEEAQSALVEMEQDRDRLRDEVHVHQERIKAMEQAPLPLKRATSTLDVGETSLDIEIEASGDEGDGASPRELRLRIRQLERQLEEVKAPATEESETAATLELLLKESNKARDRYQNDYLETNRNMLLAQAKLENILKGRNGDEQQTALALRQELDEVLAERTSLKAAKQEVEDAHEELVRQLTSAKADLNLVDKDKREIIASARDDARTETANFSQQVASLKEEMATLRERDRLHLEEIRRLMMDKIESQAAGIERNQEALDRERKLNDMRSSLEASGIPPATQAHYLDLQHRNDTLTSDIAVLHEKLQQMRVFIKNQDALFRADEQKKLSATTTEAQKAAEAKINALKKELSVSRNNELSLNSRYRVEQQLMLSAWHDIGARVVRDHVGAAGLRRPAVARPVSASWLGRQRKHQDDALFAR